MGGRVTTSKTGELLSLLLTKNGNTWFNDDYVYFLIIEKYNTLIEQINVEDDQLYKTFLEEKLAQLSKLSNDLTHLDTLYLYFMWAFALVMLVEIIGFWGKYKDKALILMMMVPMSWMAWITILEQQARYRYEGMPIIALMSGMGIYVIISFVDRIKLKKQEKYLS